MNREKLLKYGLEIFNGDLERFSNWLLKPDRSLNDKTPNELLETEEGIRAVRDVLNRIK